MDNPTDTSLLTEHDIFLFREGTHSRLYEKLGAHCLEMDGDKGTHFAVWAPNASAVSVVGDFNQWQSGAHELQERSDNCGIWEGFISGIGTGARYKYHIKSRYHGYQVNKGDPFAFSWEEPPRTASIVCDPSHQWHDREWMDTRSRHNALDAPWSIYEVHLGSWRREGDGSRLLGYRELAHALAEYVRDTGFTHVELLPIMEHPFYGSWGYQTIGYFAPSSRYGSPEDFMYFVDHLHNQGIGVILDWVPSHFPDDEHGLSYFDGTYLYEHADSKKGYHPEWHSYIFNYGRHEVRAFLLSSALFWLDRFHIDGLRVDAVASMLYLDYARKEGEWIPNEYGGRENIEAIHFLRTLNESIYRDHPDVQTIAEESTAWPMVSRPTHVGGLGFGMKWNMGWMHDTLKYISEDPVYRKYQHNQLTFSIWYAFFENFVLSLSHDEVVYGKRSLLEKMPGDDWQKFANLRLLYGYMWAHPGKKLLFMGSELGTRSEWYHETGLDWNLLQYDMHAGLHRLMRDLNRVYREQPALHEQDFSNDGFEWVDVSDWEDSVISFLRKSPQTGANVLVVCNFTPVPRTNYRVGVPNGGWWEEILNTDAAHFGGAGWGNLGGVEAAPVAAHGRYHSISLTLPPLAAVYLRNG